MPINGYLAAGAAGMVLILAMAVALLGYGYVNARGENAELTSRIAFMTRIQKDAQDLSDRELKAERAYYERLAQRNAELATLNTLTQTAITQIGTGTQSGDRTKVTDGQKRLTDLINCMNRPELEVCAALRSGGMLPVVGSGSLPAPAPAPGPR